MSGFLPTSTDGFVVTLTESEHHDQHSEAIQTILKDLDGYATTPATGSDGYVAFYTGSSGIAGDNDLFWDRENNRLRLGGMLQFSGNTATFPAIKREGEDIWFRKADDSAYTSIATANIDAYGTSIGFGLDDTSDVSIRTGGGDIIFNASPVAGTFEAPEDAGPVIIMDMPVSATPSAGDEMSMGFAVDANTVFTAHSEADGSGGIQNQWLRVDSGVVKLLQSEAPTSTDGYGAIWCEDDGYLYYQDVRTSNRSLVGGILWDDLRVSPGTTSILGLGSDPDWETFQDGVQALAFGATGTEEVHFDVQMPHTWKEGTMIHPHVHWAPSNTNTGDCRWVLEFTKAQVNGTFGSTTTIAVQDAGDGTAYKHQIAGLSGIDMDGDPLSTILMCRLYRDGGNGADTYNADAFLLSMDFHYQIDSAGSRDEYVK